MMAAPLPQESCSECRKPMSKPAYDISVECGWKFGHVRLCSSMCLLNYAISVALSEGASKTEILAMATQIDLSLNATPCGDLWDCEPCSDGADCPSMEGLE